MATGTIVKTGNKNGKGWYSNRILNLKDVQGSDPDLIPTSRLDKQYAKASLQLLNANKTPEVRQALASFRSYINKRRERGYIVFTGRAEKKQNPFIKSSLPETLTGN